MNITLLNQQLESTSSSLISALEHIRHIEATLDGEGYLSAAFLSGLRKECFEAKLAITEAMIQTRAARKQIPALRVV
jgi:hypothetical protein